MSGMFSRQEVPPPDLRSAVHRALQRPGWRFGHLTGRRNERDLAVEVLLLDTGSGGGEILTAWLPEGATGYPAITPQVPAAHWAERGLGDFFGLRAEGHPRWKSLVLHEAWPAGLAPLRRGTPDGGVAPEAGVHAHVPYAFMEVKGAGVHEIAVGPIHAGIIEPGHFRFSCLGEVIANLEIRLGYQHRGIERRLAEVPWPQARFTAEAASSDTAVGNALAHTVAIEKLLGVPVPLRADALRSIALEVERIASHLGDLGGLSADVGYSAGATIFARLRGAALGLGELLTGTRLQRGYVLPGGVARDLAGPAQSAFVEALASLARQVQASVPLILEHPAVVERMEGTGRVSSSLAREFGLVGPTARASGSHYDARTSFRHGVYPSKAPIPAWKDTGDVLARAQVRGEEVTASLRMIAEITTSLPNGAARVPVEGSLPRDQVGIGIVEAWRGELIHWITTDSHGAVQRYGIKDPSFNNWTGLAMAVRGNLVADFPLCNKSFNLSYSGNDL